MRYLLVLLVSFLGLHSLAEESSRQGNLLKRGIQFDGWQDEGLLKISDKLPKYQRLSMAEVHSLIEYQIARESDCLSRNVASDAKAKEACLDEAKSPE